MTNLPRDYDAWRLQGPHDDAPDPVGTEEGATCNRVYPPDEDAPRGYRPKPCNGVMEYGPVENCSCHINPPCSSCENHKPECDICGATEDDDE